MTNTHITGNTYEEIASEFLKSKGYIILKRNYRIKRAEIDIIAKKNNEIIFVEVKYRRNSNYGFPEEAVDYAKQRKIRYAAKTYIFENYISSELIIRFDVISILGNEIKHIKDAF